jgi:hypothetical protein
MSAYQPPIETVAIFNSQSFATTSYSGQHDPTKLNYPNAQGVPSMPSVNVTNGTNTSLITPTGITNSGAYSFNTTSQLPIVTTNSNANIVISNSTAINGGLNNIVIGKDALATATTSVQCVAIGNSSLNKLVASNATAVGHGALQNATANNTAVGSIAGGNISSGAGNTMVGFASLRSATTASSSVAIGQNAGSSVVSNSACCFIGSATDTDASYNFSVALGANSIIRKSNTIVMGTSNESVVLPDRGGLGSAVAINATPANISTNPTFSIVSINDGTPSSTTAGTVLTTSGNPPLKPNMYITGTGVTAETYIVSGALNSWVVSISQLVTANTGNYTISTYPLVVTSVSGNTLTLTTSTNNITLPIGTVIGGTGVTAGTTITANASAPIYTISNSLGTLGAFTGRYTSPNVSLTFPLSEIYYITPQTTINTPIVITLPNIASYNVGAKVTFRVVNVNATTGSSVSLVSSATNIFNSVTTATPVSTHTIYTTNTTIMLSHTFYCLPTGLGGTNYAYGWFQQGSV